MENDGTCAVCRHSEPQAKNLLLDDHVFSEASRVYETNVPRHAYVLVVFGIYCPFFAPAACWWTLQEVLSIETSCMSASAVRDSNIALNTPFLLHNRNRVYTVFQDPYRLGKSRQGAPVFDRHSIPFSIIRLDFDGLPLPVFSGSNLSRILSQSLSLISWRFCICFLSPVRLGNYAMSFAFVHYLFLRHAIDNSDTRKN
jgi:hypothetical protein